MARPEHRCNTPMRRTGVGEDQARFHGLAVPACRTALAVLWPGDVLLHVARPPMVSEWVYRVGTTDTTQPVISVAYPGSVARPRATHPFAINCAGEPGSVGRHRRGRGRNERRLAGPAAARRRRTRDH